MNQPRYFPGIITNTCSGCTYSDEFTVTGTPVPGLTLHHQGSIASKGTSQEVHYIYIDPIQSSLERLRNNENSPLVPSAEHMRIVELLLRFRD
jgi:hypothetical protein